MTEDEACIMANEFNDAMARAGYTFAHARTRHSATPVVGQFGVTIVRQADDRCRFTLTGQEQWRWLCGDGEEDGADVSIRDWTNANDRHAFIRIVRRFMGHRASLNRDAVRKMARAIIAKELGVKYGA